MARRITTAREQLEMLSPWRHTQVEMLSPWRREALIKVARYPQEWRSGDAPYGSLPSGRARNRPPSVLRDPDNPKAGTIDPSEIRYVKPSYSDSVSAFHPNGHHLGNYSWEDDGGDNAHIGIAQVSPKYQGQGVSGAIIDHIREHHKPNLVHSGYQGRGSLSYQGRAGALRDLGNTEQEHNDYFNTRPYNYGAVKPEQFSLSGPNGREIHPITEDQQRAHDELVKQFEEDRSHPNYTGTTSSGSGGDPDLVDEYGDRHEYGYDSSGDYVGLSGGTKNEDGYSEEGYDHEGYGPDGFNSEGYDRFGRDENGYHSETGLNLDGETRHGYTPGDGTPPEGTIPMSQMPSHDGSFVAPTMYAVRDPGEVSPFSGRHHVGNGDTLYSSLERARQVAYHPDDPSEDKNIVSVDHLDPDYLHTDASGKTPEDFHYAPDSSGLQGFDMEATTSTPADFVHDPHRHQRILSDLGHGWSQSTESPLSENSGFEYTDPNSGRIGRMYQQSSDGNWRTQHQPEFGGRRMGQYQTHREAADAIHQGTAPGPTADQHALEVNNDYGASGEGNVEWKPHPLRPLNRNWLTAHTPHGDLHLVQDTSDGRWNWHAGPHDSLPGEEGNMRAPLSDSLTRAAESGVRALTRSPFHGGLKDELGEGWGPHPRSAGVFSRRLPSGDHAFVAKNADGTYGSGIQRDNGSGAPSTSRAYRDDMPDLAQALAFIQHRENPVPAKALGEGWRGDNLGPRYFPSYVYEDHPSDAAATVAWGGGGPRSRDGEKPGWLPTVHHGGGLHPGPTHSTPQEAAAWASSFMDGLGKPTA